MRYTGVIASVSEKIGSRLFPVGFNIYCKLTYQINERTIETKLTKSKECRCLGRSTVLAIVGLTGLVACGPPPPPLTPVQIAANQWAGAEGAVAQCSGYIGGFSDAQALKAEAAKDS